MWMIALVSLASGQEAPAPADDPYLWLEEVEGEQAMAQVVAWNEATRAILEADPRFAELTEEALAILTDDARIPQVHLRGEDVHDFRQDAEHLDGLWRRASLADFLAGEPAWETLLDVGALGAKEGERWVWGGAHCLPGSDRCMVELSRGGSDAAVYREFSLTTRDFVPDGFVLPEAKSQVHFLDHDTLIVGTDQGEGSLTDAGYSRRLLRWSRGTPLDQAPVILEGETSDAWVDAQIVHTDHPWVFFERALSFFEFERSMLGDDGQVVPLPLPPRSYIQGVIGGRVLVWLHEDWDWQGTTWPSGAIIALDPRRDLATELVYQPGEGEAVTGLAVTRSAVVVQLLHDVAGQLVRLTRKGKGWRAKALPFPANGVVELAAASDARDDLLVSTQSLTEPNALLHVSAKGKVTVIQQLPALYDASDVVVEQRFASSTDGTRVPYFVMGRRDVLAAGGAPTIEYGYGGFQVPILPYYFEESARPQHGALAGRLWVARGGVLAIANIRGGGEYGPAWHQAALGPNRQRAFDDFFAVGEDLIASGTTAPGRLGAIGRSNGGLLMGVSLTQRPDLYAAIDCGVPLLDMLRYHLLLAGASWIGEYGDPDRPEDRAHLEAWSPYQHVQPDVDYPSVLFYTSTKDDRVHPGHARKMAAKLMELGNEVYWYENVEGGHGGTVDPHQLAERTALEYLFFLKELVDPEAP